MSYDNDFQGLKIVNYHLCCVGMHCDWKEYYNTLLLSLSINIV